MRIFLLLTRARMFFGRKSVILFFHRVLQAESETPFPVRLSRKQFRPQPSLVSSAFRRPPVRAETKTWSYDNNNVTIQFRVNKWWQIFLPSLQEIPTSCIKILNLEPHVCLLFVLMTRQSFVSPFWPRLHQRSNFISIVAKKASEVWELGENLK